MGLQVIRHASVDNPIRCETFLEDDGTPVFQSVEKMGKSKQNSVDPLEIIADYGADTLRHKLVRARTPKDAIKLLEDELIKFNQ